MGEKLDEAKKTAEEKVKEVSDKFNGSVDKAVENIKKEVLGEDGKFDGSDVERMAKNTSDSVGGFFKNLFK